MQDSTLSEVRRLDLICAWGDTRIDRRPPLPTGRRLAFVGRVPSSGHAALEPINPANKRAGGGTVVGASGVAARNGRDTVPNSPL
jgi:hypothetical protein